MKKLMSARWAGSILLVAFGLLVIFDGLLLVGVVPSSIVWGGQISAAANNQIPLEVTALVVTLIFAGIVAAKMGYILAGRFRRAVKVGLWIIFIYMILNTVGNLASGVTVEGLIFAPVTVILAVCALRLALE